MNELFAWGRTLRYYAGLFFRSKTFEAIIGLLLVLFLTAILPSILYGATSYSPIPPYSAEEAEIINEESGKIGEKYGKKILKLLQKRFKAVPPKTRQDIAIQVGWAIDYYSPNIKAKLVLLLERNIKDPDHLREALDHLNVNWALTLQDIYKTWVKSICLVYGIDPNGYIPTPEIPSFLP